MIVISPDALQVELRAGFLSFFWVPDGTQRAGIANEVFEEANPGPLARRKD